MGVERGVVRITKRWSRTRCWTMPTASKVSGGEMKNESTDVHDESGGQDSQGSV